MGSVGLNGGREASVALKLVLRSIMNALLLAERKGGGWAAMYLS